MLQSLECPACGSSSLAVIGVHATDKLYASIGLLDQKAVLDLKKCHSIAEYKLIKCAGCGLEFAQPLRAPSADWYAILYKSLGLYPAQRWEYDFVLKHTSVGSSICDVGCGDGQFIRRAAEAGFVSTGIDFSGEAVANGKARGLSIYHLEMSDLRNEEAAAHDTVVSFHAIEHLESPEDVFSAARHFGGADCKLWISVPSDRRPSRAYSEADFLDLPPHHMTRWTQESLRALGLRNGWLMRAFFYEPLSFKQIVWNVTVRSPLYRGGKTVLEGHKWLERLFRAVLFIPIGWVALFSRQRMSGFTMLALFERDVDV